MDEDYNIIASLEDNINFKEMISEFLPAIFELIPHDERKWEELETEFVNNQKIRYQSYIENNSEPIPIKPSLYDYITDAKNGEPYDKHFLGFINKVLEEIIDNFSMNEKRLLMDSIYGVIVNFDNQFLNYLGEILIANQIQKNGFTILDREILVHSDFPDGKKIDFVVKNNSTKEVHNIEVVNIHFNNTNEDVKYLTNRITKRLSKKLSKKKENGVTNKFTLIPTFWCTITQIHLINKLYAEKAIQIQDTFPPCVFIMESNEEIVIYRFGLLTSYFDSQGKFQESIIATV